MRIGNVVYTGTGDMTGKAIHMTRYDRLGNPRQVEVTHDTYDGQWVGTIYSGMPTSPPYVCEVLAIGSDRENPELAADAAIDAFNRRTHDND